jgi:hypothetical protein
MSILRPEDNSTQMEDIVFLYRYLFVDSAMWYARNYIYLMRAFDASEIDRRLLAYCT